MRRVVAVMVTLCMGGCCGGEELDPAPQTDARSASAARPPRVCTMANLDESVSAYKTALTRVNSVLDGLGIDEARKQRRARMYIRAVCIEGNTLNPPERIDGELLCMNARVNRAYYDAYVHQDEMVKVCSEQRRKAR